MQKAIIFTHWSSQMKRPDEVYNPESRDSLIDRVLPYYKAYLKCRNIRLVYVYVDTGLRLALQHYNQQDNNMKFSIEELEYEHNTRNCLKLAVDRAEKELMEDRESGFDPLEAPQFQFVGLPHLSSLIRTLYRNNPKLIQLLSGEKGIFTYDSPKFVDAIIRLSFKDNFPILRVDADVEVNERGIEEILKCVSKIPNGRYAFFSGGYGTYEKECDPINDYAVRLHWLVDKKVYNSGIAKNDPALKEKSLSVINKIFLRDLGELGATQIPSGISPFIDCSPQMKDYVKKERDGKSFNRSQQQVISGAGLYMNYETIYKLPPFMCFTSSTLWVDDYLKRLLHEVLDDLSAREPMHVEGALFVQDRHPEGLVEPITDADIRKINTDYFEKLIRGCILDSLIRKPSGEMGLLAAAIKQTITTGEDFNPMDDVLKEWEKEAISTATKILKVWENTKYGNKTLSDWASSAGTSISPLVEQLVKDAAEYVRVVHRWPQFERAITGLHDYQAYWLKRDLDSTKEQRVV